MSDTRGTAHRRDDDSKKVPIRLVTLAVLTAALIALSLLIASPFLHAVTWGVALAIIGWPMHKVVRARVASPTVAALISTAAVFLLIVVPGVFVIFEVSNETEAIAQKVKTPPDQMMSRDTLKDMPGGSRVVGLMEKAGVDVEAELKKVVSSVLPNIGQLAQGFAAVAAQFLIAMFILFYVFRDRGEFLHGLRELLPLTRAESDQLFTSAADSVYANLYATLVTGLIDSGTGTMLFWIFGVPAPFLWGAVMFVLSILPMVGAGMIWVPTAIYLATTGSWLAAFVIMSWGIFTAVAVDYLLYARLAGDRMRMHAVPALLAFLGGLAIFGLSGMILGPAIVATTAAMLDLWRERSSNTEESALADAS
jgi:predicted PurR-regulated permease PerM